MSEKGLWVSWSGMESAISTISKTSFVIIVLYGVGEIICTAVFSVVKHLRYTKLVASSSLMTVSASDTPHLLSLYLMYCVIGEQTWLITVSPVIITPWLHSRCFWVLSHHQTIVNFQLQSFILCGSILHCLAGLLILIILRSLLRGLLKCIVVTASFNFEPELISELISFLICWIH